MTRKLIEQMQQALEHTEPWIEGLSVGSEVHTAITAAREYLAQPEQSEPIGYVYSQDGRKEGCIQDSSIPNGTPLYTATQMREFRNQALEDAAKVCEQFTHYGEASGIICVKAIRELKEVQS